MKATASGAFYLGPEFSQDALPAATVELKAQTYVI
jgi:hypothetical protein